MKAMNSLKYLGLAALTSSLAFATNITIKDPFNDSGFFNNSTTGATQGDVEAGYVESGAATGNVWDLASFSLTGSKLTMTGGLNFDTGAVPHAATPFPVGDIFVFSGVPYTGALSTPLPANATATDPNRHNWDYVIHFQRGLIGGYPVDETPIVSGMSFNYQILSKTTVDQHSTYYTTQNPSGHIYDLPWMVGDVQSVNWQVGTYVSGLGAESLFFNSMTVDISSILGLVDDPYVHLTLRCGNDVMWGRVPDGGFTLVLLSLGLGGLALAVRRRK